MNTNIDYTLPSTLFTFDVNRSHFFVKDNQNFINILGKKQLNTLENTSLLDIYLSSTNIVEPHYHPNSSELVYCISGVITVSILNPFTNQVLDFSIIPGQVVNVPNSWWHYEVATADNTHILAIFDSPNPEVILASDILKYTPSNIMAHTYCMNEEDWKNVTKNIEPDTYIGPYRDCNKNEYLTHESYIPTSQYLEQKRYYPYNLKI